MPPLYEIVSKEKWGIRCRAQELVGAAHQWGQAKGQLSWPLLLPKDKSISQGTIWIARYGAWPCNSPNGLHIFTADADYKPALTPLCGEIKPTICDGTDEWKENVYNWSPVTLIGGQHYALVWEIAYRNEDGDYTQCEIRRGTSGFCDTDLTDHCWYRLLSNSGWSAWELLLHFQLAYILEGWA